MFWSKVYRIVQHVTQNILVLCMWTEVWGAVTCNKCHILVKKIKYLHRCRSWASSWPLCYFLIRSDKYILIFIIHFIDISTSNIPHDELFGFICKEQLYCLQCNAHPLNKFDGRTLNLRLTIQFGVQLLLYTDTFDAINQLYLKLNISTIFETNYLLYHIRVGNLFWQILT